MRVYEREGTKYKRTERLPPYEVQGEKYSSAPFFFPAFPTCIHPPSSCESKDGGATPKGSGKQMVRDDGLVEAKSKERVLSPSSSEMLSPHPTSSPPMFSPCEGGGGCIRRGRRMWEWGGG